MAPQCYRARDNLRLTLPRDGPGCINKVLINVFKKINTLPALVKMLILLSLWDRFTTYEGRVSNAAW